MKRQGLARRMTQRVAWLALCVSCALPGCAILSPLRDDARDAGRPTSVILLIGDGMGVSQLTAGKIVKGTLRLEEFSTGGLLMTHALDVMVTDSAAAATALATGRKTYDGGVAMSAEAAPLKTVLEYAADAGKSVGLVTTHAVTDATPAAFVAHVADRARQEDIAEQIAARNVDVLFGGGWGYFVPRTHEGSLRTDDKYPMRDMARRLTVARTPEEFHALPTTGKIAALLAPRHLPPAAGRPVSLPAMTRKAIQTLSRNPRGFLLMVEGAQIDGGGHIQSADFIVAEMMDFDDAVGEALDFARADGKTLVVVTADHETGGLAIHGGSIERRQLHDTRFTSRGHTAAMVPLFAFGPGRHAFGGIRDNTFVGSTLIDYLRHAAD